jgi:GrpB-like predicted nucleotidyltransferase (UPF0157 family)
MEKNLEQRITEAIREEISIVPYNQDWPRLFEEEAGHLCNLLPNSLLKRIEHFGSTAIPGMSAKPIIDMLVEVSSLAETQKRIVPILVAEQYDYFWRPAFDDPHSEHYAWFIKRNTTGIRTHHLHMVEQNSALWERLLFRDFLREFPEEARRYEQLKTDSSEKFHSDRVAYTKSKTAYVLQTTQKAKKYFMKK